MARKKVRRACLALAALLILAGGLAWKSTRFREWVRLDGPAGEDLEVADYFKAKNWILGAGARLREVKTLCWFRPNCRDARMLAKSRRLQSLDLSTDQIDDAALSALAASPTLEELLIRSQRLTDASLRALGACASLKSLELTSYGTVTDAGLGELAALPRLETLTLIYLNLAGPASRRLPSRGRSST
jgi:hypothetical protein